ncbi:MAG: ABC transporter substrate-binding protein [Acidobacteriaceae bacterium]
MRIASLQPSITITLAQLGRLDMLAACTRYCVEALPELAALGIPVLHDSWSAHTEEILAANPDMVMASVPYRMESLAAILKTGLPVLALAPHSIADIEKDTRLIASLVHAVEEGEVLINAMRSRIAQMRTQSHPSRESPLVYCEEWGKPLIRSQHWVAELVQAAGGNFLGDPGKATTQEEVAAADPDVVILAWCGAGDRVPLRRVIEQRGWQQLRAVQHGRVHCVPDELLNTPAITLLEGLACLAAAIHPQIFPPHPRLITLV